MGYRSWGSVTVNTGSGSVKVGVRLDEMAGSPSNAAPNAVFTATPIVGTAPLTVMLDASGSNDSDGYISSYYWDFGDGTYGTGVSTSHVYAQGTFTPVLTVTDDAGLSDTAWTNVSVSPTLTNISLTGVPSSAIDPGTSVALTAAAVGGYQTQFKFLLNSGSGWTTLRDYASGRTLTWTPASAGYYEIKAYAKSSDSTRVYDLESNTLSYPVGQLPQNGIKLWLKADSGVTKDGTGLVSFWADQSGAGNNVSQINLAYQPTSVECVINGRPAIHFGGGSQMLQTPGLVLTGNTNFTSFIVGRLMSPIQPGTYQYFWWNGADNYNTGYGVYLNNSNPQRLDASWGTKTVKAEYPIDVVPGTWYRISSRLSGAADPKTNEIWVNGDHYVAQYTKSGSNLGGTGAFFSLGNFGPAQSKGLFGDIAEVIIYNRDLQESERTRVENYLSARWTPPVAISLDKIKDVKALADGVLVSITSPKVAVAASGTYSDAGYYIEESDRTCGLKLVGGPVVALWDNLAITGTTGTDLNTGERVLMVSSLGSQTTGTALGSLGLANRAFSASGQLVRVWGKVTTVTSTYITLDDGSGSPVRVEIDGLLVPIGSVPTIGQYASATGPAGFMVGGAAAIRPRSGSDIQVY